MANATTAQPETTCDVADPDDFLAAVAQAYHDCALGGVDMRVAVAALESIREAPTRNVEAYPTWRELDDQIGRAVNQRLAAALVALRQRYEQALLQRCPASASSGFPSWARALGHALTEWRVSLCEAMAATPALEGLAPEDAADMAALPQRFAAMKLGDWDQVVPAFEWLSRQTAIDAGDRARFLARAAQVDLYFAADPARARARLEQAALLAGTSRAAAEVESVAGQCCIEEQDSAGAIERLERAASIDSRFVESFGYRGDVALKANDLTTAESWYRRALAAHPGSSTGYLRLARLLARPELFDARRAEIAGLVDRAVLVVPLEAATILAEVADVLREADDLAGALHFADRAVDSGPQHGRSHYARGLVHAASEAWQLALDDFRTAIRLEPTRYEKTRWYALGRPGALRLLLAELDQHPGEAMVRDALLCYVEQSNGLAQELDGALSAVAALLRSLPPGDGEAAASLANARGDLHYAVEDYAAAREAFRLALELAPKVLLYSANLLASLRALEAWDDAEDVLAAAVAGGADLDWSTEQRAWIENDHGNALFGEGRFTEAATRYASAAALTPDEATYRHNETRALDQTLSGAIDAETLDVVEAALDRACARAPDDAGYRARRDAMVHVRAGMSRYGLHKLAAKPYIARIRVAANLRPWVSPDGIELSEELSNTVAGMRAWFQEDLGVQLPGVNFFEEAGFDDGEYELELLEMPVRRDAVRTDRRLLTGLSVLAQARDRGFVGEAATHPLNGEAAMWIDQADWERVAALGFPLWGIMDYPVYDLSYQILRRLKDFVGHSEAQELLYKHSPPSSSRFRDEPGLLTRLVGTIRGLLAERVPINAFTDIAEQVAATPTGPLFSLVRACRTLPAVRAVLPGNDREAHRLDLPEALERAVAAHVEVAGAEPVLALSSLEAKEILAGVGELVMAQPAPSALVVRDPALRPHVRRLIELAYPQLWVLSRDEIVREVAAAAPAPETPS